VQTAVLCGPVHVFRILCMCVIINYRTSPSQSLYCGTGASMLYLAMYGARGLHAVHNAHRNAARCPSVTGSAPASASAMRPLCARGGPAKGTHTPVRRVQAVADIRVV
jgi:hypothetical protein